MISNNNKRARGPNKSGGVKNAKKIISGGKGGTSIKHLRRRNYSSYTLNKKVYLMYCHIMPQFTLAVQCGYIQDISLNTFE